MDQYDSIAEDLGAYDHGVQTRYKEHMVGQRRRHQAIGMWTTTPYLKHTNDTRNFPSATSSISRTIFRCIPSQRVQTGGLDNGLLVSLEQSMQRTSLLLWCTT